MIEHRVGDLLNDTSIDVICHQANLFHTFGGGIARIIREKFPEAYAADCATLHGDKTFVPETGDSRDVQSGRDKLGTYSKAKLADGRMILNCYSQTGMGATDRNTSYNDILIIFKAIEEKTRIWNDANPGNEKVIGVPYKYGCGLAGGAWRIVLAIFEEVFKNSPVKLVIVRLPSEPEVVL